MAAVGNWIPDSTAQTRLPQQLRGAILQLAQAAATFQTLANIQSQMVGGGSDYSTVETYFGIPTGSGQTLSAVLGTANGDLQGGNIQGLLQRFG
jgi:hypothetical protein